MNRSSFKLFR